MANEGGWPLGTRPGVVLLESQPGGFATLPQKEDERLCECNCTFAHPQYTSISLASSSRMIKSQIWSSTA